MKREQAAFLGAGILFGFVLGFVVAWGIARSPETPAMPAARAPRGNTDPMAGSGGGDGMGPMEQQIADLKGRIAADPADGDALVELGVIYMQVGMYPQARGYLEQALAADPSNHHARLHLGVVLGQTGDMEGARREFETVVASDPGGWQGWFYLAVTAVRTQDLERAREAVAQVERLNPGLPELAELKQQLGG
ncbi:MAG: tetratricopeptide repeat protein [Acidobacteriota bacterium]|jgi:cytochrome c-type biogenesis protein CcmH/NrfG